MPNMIPQKRHDEDFTAKQSTNLRTRFRKEHHLSEGESESEELTICYRALRKDENPQELGLQPRPEGTTSIGINAHIRAGSRAAEKSTVISATRSIKVAAAWSVATTAKDGRVCKFSLNGISKYYDLTNPDHQEILDLKGLALNNAKASQEVVILEPVPKENIIEIYSTSKKKVSEYKELKEKDKESSDKYVRTRNRVKTSPIPIVLTPTLNLNEGSSEMEISDSQEEA